MNQQLLSDLARVKVLFQARALAAAMGIPAPTPLHTAATLEEAEAWRVGRVKAVMG